MKTVELLLKRYWSLASSAQYNGTDWNGDGDIGSFSDQYIMITNTGTDPVDISDWILDGTDNGGSHRAE